jgi:phage-related tail fiber protein
MPQKFTNNARSTITSTIADNATSLTIQPSAADLFPVADVGTGTLPSTDDWFKATLQDVSGNVEIIYVRTRNSGSPTFSNILRGQEGTTARSFVAGTVVGLRLTALDYEASITAIENLVATAAFVPTGSVFHFAASTAPAGYLEADGTAVSRTTYAALFAVTGTTFGAGDGSTTFNLPDLRAEFIRGWDDGRGVDVDRAFGSAQEDALKAHKHDIRVRGSNSSHSHRINDGFPETYVAAGASNSLGGASTVYNDGGAILDSGSTETRPRNVALLACIKT